MCRFETVTKVFGGQESDAPNVIKVCDRTGNMLACQFCPDGPSYWQATARPASASPWDGGGRSSVMEVQELPAHEHENLGEGWHKGPEGPCVLCLKPTTLHSPKRVPVHRTCAADYQAGKRQFARPR